jgi:nucleoside-diphosphate-sugar epimerase
MNVLRREAVVVTGGSGFVGGLIAAALLVDDSATVVVLPIRPHHDVKEVLWHIAFGVSTLGHDFSDDHRARLRLVPMESPDQLRPGDLPDLCLSEIVHSAGCLDYFDKENLEAVNVDLTRRMIERGRLWGVRRFTYISTAYSCGYIEGTAPESLHPEPSDDPTDYTRTKRRAERLVAESGLPFHIVRPSILVGTSATGQYTGKRYGVYQLWNGLERLMCRKWVPVLHAVGAHRKVHLVHQDSFQRAFLAARRRLPDGSFLHVTTPAESAPTMRQLWDLWLHACARPQQVVYYDRMDQLPMREIDTRQRAFLSLGWTNLEISSRHWEFAADNLQGLRASGLEYADVTLESLENCQRLFLQESETVQAFLKRHQNDLAPWPPVRVNFAGA